MPKKGCKISMLVKFLNMRISDISFCTRFHTLDLMLCCFIVQWCYILSPMLYCFIVQWSYVLSNVVLFY